MTDMAAPGSTRRVEGGVLAVPGFRGATARCGLYDEPRDDLALIVADRECETAGVFTRNQVPAAPIILTRERLHLAPRARSIVINAGNANALTGPAGLVAAERMLARLEETCGGPALVLSTGVIGVPFPLDPVLAGIGRASTELTSAADGAVARAILTTDTRPKTSATQVDLPGEARSVTLGGVAKGSGMIHPNMATMLAVIAIDRAIPAALLSSMLRASVDVSFHEISVDGDTSTNDAVLVLARPTEGEDPVAAGSAAAEALGRALTAVCRDLAAQIVADGEGMTKVLRVEVQGARSDFDAKRIASTIAGSLLVKTAVAGRDPNWGRFIAVAGNAGVPIDPSRLELALGGVIVYTRGQPREISAAETSRIFADDVVVARLSLGVGTHGARMATTDLTYEYVRINAEYTT